MPQTPKTSHTPRRRRDDEPWYAKALCLQIGPDLFFPPQKAVNEDPRAYREAREACQQCPVWRECLVDALVTEIFVRDKTTRISPSGMRGGRTPREREELYYRLRRTYGVSVLNGSRESMSLLRSVIDGLPEPCEVMSKNERSA